jgi:aspartyl-tRNA(Asn)/glutamyl-tRNA(Gln) amidotransferase subunit A
MSDRHILSGSVNICRRTLIQRSIALGATTVLASSPAVVARRAVGLEASPMPASIGDAGKRFRSGSLSSLRLTEAYFSYIDRFEPSLNIFISQLRDRALQTAKERDAELAKGKDRGPLHGIPIVVKDLYEMSGTRTTVGSKAFADRQSAEDATVIRKLLNAGAVVLGKTNMNEFAAGISGTNAYFGDCHNPWSLEHAPGGSSSGNAAAMAAGIGLGAAGSDTGGSIRVPASWCGVAGIRPTYGLVSLNGVFPRAYSLDAAGPLARNVTDLGVLLDVMAGFDPLDRSSALSQRTASYTQNIDAGVKGIKFGIVKNYTYKDVDTQVAAAIAQAAETYAQLGAKVVEVTVEPLEGGLDYNKLFTNILLYEFNEIMGDRYRSTPNATDVYGPIVQNNIEVGSKVQREEYERTVKERPAIIASLKEAFGEVDALITPALPTVAPLLKASAQDFGRGRQFTIPFSYAALPSVVVPCGFSSEGLPIGLQIVGNHFHEAMLLRLSYAFEQATTFHKRRPPIFCDVMPS